MKKHLTLIISSLILGLILSGVNAKAERTTIKFENVWGGTRIPLMERMIEKFESQHPNIKVNSILIPQPQMNERYLTAIAGGSPSDVIMVKRSYVPYFGMNNALLPLGEYIDRDNMDLREIFYDAEVDLSQWEGKTYVLPSAVGGGGYILFWNEDLFAKAGLNPKKAPQTWGNFQEYSKKLTKFENGRLKTLGGSVSQGGTDLFLEWLFCNNGRLLSADGRKVLFNSPEGIETLRWMVNFIDSVPKSMENVVELCLSSLEGIYRYTFFQGNAGMYIDGVWMFYQFATEIPQLNYGAGMVPYNDENPKAKSLNVLSAPWGYAIPKGAKHPDEAWEWIKYTCAGEGCQDFYRAQARPTAVRAYNEDPWYKENNPHWDVVLKTLANSQAVVMTPFYSQMIQSLSDEIEKAYRHKKNPESALREAAKKVQEIADKFYKK